MKTKVLYKKRLKEVERLSKENEKQITNLFEQARRRFDTVMRRIDSLTDKELIPFEPTPKWEGISKQIAKAIKKYNMSDILKITIDANYVEVITITEFAKTIKRIKKNVKR